MSFVANGCVLIICSLFSHFSFHQAHSSDEIVAYPQGPTFDIDDDDDEHTLVPDEVLPLDELIKGAATGSVFDPVDLRNGMTLAFFTMCRNLSFFLVIFKHFY